MKSLLLALMRYGQVGVAQNREVTLDQKKWTVAQCINSRDESRVKRDAWPLRISYWNGASTRVRHLFAPAGVNETAQPQCHHKNAGERELTICPNKRQMMRSGQGDEKKMSASGVVMSANRTRRCAL